MIQVSRVTLTETGQFSVDFKRSDDPVSVRDNSTFDVVVVATPQTRDNGPIEFFVSSIEKPKFPGSFHRTVATLVHGDLNPNYLSGQAPETSVIFMVNPGSKINSISLEYPVDYLPGEQSKYFKT